MYRHLSQQIARIFYQKSFTLIELLIVLAILGIVSTMAYPSYKAYSAKAAVVKAVDRVQPILKQISDYYTKTGGNFPSSITYGGQSAILYFSVYPDVDGINRIQYANGTPVDGTEIIVHITPIEGLSDWTTSRTVGIGFRVNSASVMRYACGDPGTGNPTIPYKYLPTYCTCTNVHVWTTGANPTGCPS